MTDNKNFILAIVVSALIIFGWQFLYVGPQMEKQRQLQQQQQQTTAPQTQPGAAPQSGTAAPSAVPLPTQAQGSVVLSREDAIARAPRIAIETPALSGSLNLKGAAFDDLHLVHYHEAVDPQSPTITLLSPADTEHAYYAEEGWLAAAGSTVKLPDSQTVWSAAEGTKLTPTTPVTLTYDNGQGVTFKNTYAVDDNYMFTVKQEVDNHTGAALSLIPYARVVRVGEPKITGSYLLHEGLHGYLNGEVRAKYKDIKKDGQPVSATAVGGWLGITDKYWAVALVPAQTATVNGTFRYTLLNNTDRFQADYVDSKPVAIPPGGSAEAQGQMFAGAKVVRLINAYEDTLKIDHFDLMVDWGWFYFLTKPMFWFLETIYGLVGNFGLAILIVTVMVKGLFFPLANKSYESMTKMKKLQPQMERVKQLFPDDRMRQQQELMDIYKKEKVSPVSGCLPVVVQIPVFFALYKVLYGTIEMRHAHFFGWIRDLSAPDPTSLFNLFGLIPWHPPLFLMIGAWPLIMGVTMWMQMRLNPTPPDPVQATMFNWMPIIFTFMLASFPAGLVIYWAWNNSLSILQQSIIMKRLGVKVDFIGNIRNSLPFLRRNSGGTPE